MRRHIAIRSTNEERSSRRSILLTDFKFYNRMKQVIDNNILLQYEALLKEDTNAIRYWTNELFWKQGLAFKFFTTMIRTGYKNDENEEPSVEIIDTNGYVFGNVEDVLACRMIIKNFWFIQFLPTDRQYTYLVEVDDNILRSSLQPTIFKTWDEVVRFILKNNLFNVEYENFEQISKDADELFGVKIKECEYEITNKSGNFGSVKIKHIFHVEERRYGEHNYRIYFVTKPDRWSKEFLIEARRDDDKYYNYIDNDRIFFVITLRDFRGVDRVRYYFLDNGLTQTVGKKVYINLDLFALLARNIQNILGEERFVITPQIFRFYSERFSTIIVNKNDINDEVEIEILEKYKKLLLKGREVKMDGLILKNNKIEVEDQPFKMQFSSSFFNVSKHLTEIRRIIKNEDVRYNFNNLYENILKMSELKIINMNNTGLAEYKEFKDAVFLLNGMQMVIRKDEDSNRIMINDVFCRIDDVFQVLNRAICFTNLDDYMKYIRDVGYIGHEWKRLIGTGVQIELENPFNAVMRRVGQLAMERLILRFSFLWDIKRRTKVYLIVNGEKYFIKQKNKFKIRFNVPRITMNMRQLKQALTASIPELTDDQIIEVVEHAVKEGEIIKQKAAELVKKTVDDINAIETEIVVANSKKIGYVFRGRISNAEYFVDANDLNVYKKVDGMWNRRCVVNDHTKHRIFEDWLANRLVNVFNEPAKIQTLHNV